MFHSSLSQRWMFLLFIILWNPDAFQSWSPAVPQRPTSSCRATGIAAWKLPMMTTRHHGLVLSAKPDPKDDDLLRSFMEDDDSPVIIRGTDKDFIDGAIWEDIETGQPAKEIVMKELLGINVFTYILAGLIVFFLSMNYFIGPGWLGSILGIPGTGSINEVSDSIPDTMDLSASEYLL